MSGRSRGRHRADESTFLSLFAAVLGTGTLIGLGLVILVLEAFLLLGSPFIGAALFLIFGPW